MYDALIVVNGEIPRRELWQGIRYRTLICTDGASLSLQNLALTPDIIIGDMDSISDGTHFATVKALEMRFPKSKIHQIEDQETTDFEKALDFALNQKFQQVICLGALGKSADHSFHNLCLLNRYSQKLNLMLLHTFDTSRQWIFPLFSKTCIHTQKGALISFIPFPQAKLTSEDLKWRLTDSILTQTSQNAVRNITTKELVTVTCEGLCVCVLTAEVLPLVTNEGKA